ncbi:MAG: hypothetical protein LQ342_004405 [Letrouitia transgressa]|nr:MAG: hypothetical protein LQ342_004405 [Letrouitia transgressa]
MEITVSKSPDSTNSVINEGALSDEALPNWVQQNSTEKSGPDVVKSALRLM